MTRRLGLRSRLTLLVTLVFGAAMTITSVVVVQLVEDDLVANTRANAESVLSSFVESASGGAATVGVVDATDTTRFFYQDSDGNELTEEEYFEIITAELESELPGIGGVTRVDGDAASASDELGIPFEDMGIASIDAETGELLDANGAVVTLLAGPESVGDPRPVDLGPDVVGVAQTLAFDDGTTFDVGVSSPLQPVTDSLDTIRQLLWIAVPALVAAIAAITWLAATRALAPVHAITEQAQAITAANIDERVPVHAAKDEIRELATTMNAMLARLEGSQRRQHQLVADASHELRSPVAASRTQLEVAVAHPETVDWSETAATVLAEQEHLGSLIDDLLALSRLDEAGPRRTEDIDLDDVISAEADRPHPTPVRTSIAAPVRVTGDRALLARAIRNLVDNASRHADHDVLVTLHRRDGCAVIDVDDDGPGVPDDQHEQIFDRFTRTDEARDRHTGGAGLGLAIAREVARAHDGDVTVARSPLGGARFTLTIAEPSG